MKTRNKMLEKGIAKLDPLADEDLQSLVAESNPEELLGTILSTPTPERGRRDRAAAAGANARWRRPALFAAPAVAAALLALTVGFPGGGDGVQTLPALARVAEAAAAQPAPALDAPYRYLKTREITLDATSEEGGYDWSWLESATNEEWIAGDGSGLVRRNLATPKWASAADREEWEASGRLQFLAHGWAPHTEEHRYGPGHFGEGLYVAPDRADSRLSNLPTDPAKLADWLEGVVDDPKSEGDAGRTVRALTLVTDLLNEPLASPELRAALYEALGLISGIESFGEMTDAAGRKGVAVGLVSAYSGARTRYTVILDPETSRVLATEQIQLQPPAAMRGEHSPQLVEAKLFLESRGADSLGG